jgi:hypothetical protein
MKAKPSLIRIAAELLVENDMWIPMLMPYTCVALESACRVYVRDNKLDTRLDKNECVKIMAEKYRLLYQDFLGEEPKSSLFTDLDNADHDLRIITLLLFAEWAKGRNLP